MPTHLHPQPWLHVSKWAAGDVCHRCIVMIASNRQLVRAGMAMNTSQLQSEPVHLQFRAVGHAQNVFCCATTTSQRQNMLSYSNDITGLHASGAAHPIRAAFSRDMCQLEGSETHSIPACWCELVVGRRMPLHLSNDSCNAKAGRSLSSCHRDGRESCYCANRLQLTLHVALVVPLVMSEDCAQIHSNVVRRNAT
jgi:hypothetical protein